MLLPVESIGVSSNETLPCHKATIHAPLSIALYKGYTKCKVG